LVQINRQLQIVNDRAMGNSLFTIDHSLPGMMNIGVRPTIGGINRVIEINIFDYNEEIYGQTLRVFVKKFLRPEKKFNGLDALKQQLEEDKKESIKLLH
jgi:riboflavin kinase / FMN adenylyltransferase